MHAVIPPPLQLDLHMPFDEQLHLFLVVVDTVDSEQLHLSVIAIIPLQNFGVLYDEQSQCICLLRLDKTQTRSG